MYQSQKIYLSAEERKKLNEIVTMYLDYATRQARRHIPMIMADWASKLDALPQFTDVEILQDKGKSQQQSPNHLQKVNLRNTESSKIVCTKAILTV